MGLGNQMLWLIYALDTEQYGLLVGIVAFFVVHARNLRKWRQS